ncbi:MAG: aldo/keto reductase [Clostridia bacterium]|nr:aldo/keto reductase [Clostridia bacterium]
MQKVMLGTTGREMPAVVVGCMRLAGKNCDEMQRFIHAAQDLGATYFDHADIYGGGQSESIFGQAMAADPSIKREEMFLQSKCGIRKGFFDFSKEYILSSVDGILQRLQTDYLDCLLLHRPDALMEPEEVAAAFDQLEQSGKVRHFGVSNHSPMQMELMKTCVKQPLIINQLQFSIPVSNMVAAGLEVNMTTAGSFNRDGSVLDYSRLNKITIQAWSPFQMENWQGCFIDSDKFPELNREMAALAEKFGVSKTTVATAWILRHPANMQVVSGTANEQRLAEIVAAEQVSLSREEWYRLYLAAGHILP